MSRLLCLVSKTASTRITSRSFSSALSASLKKQDKTCMSRHLSISASDSDDLLISKSEGLLTIKLNRPSKLNSIKQSMYLDFSKALDSSSSDPDVRMVLLTGSGQYYSAGNDLSAFAKISDPAAALQEAKRVLHIFLSSLIDFPKPLVIGVNGPAIGIMVTTLALADIVWCSETATFAAPFSATAQSPEGCSTKLFPLIFGRSLANEILMLNRKLDAAEALAKGLVSRVLPSSGDSFVHEVEKQLKEYIATVSTESMAASKSLIMDHETREALKKCMQNENDVLAQRWMSDEFPAFIMKFMTAARSKNKK